MNIGETINEFYKRFSPGYVGWATPLSLHKEFEDFLRSTLQARDAALVEKLRGMKSTQFFPIPDKNYNVSVGWNKAIDTIITHLTEEQ